MINFYDTNHDCVDVWNTWHKGKLFYMITARLVPVEYQVEGFTYDLKNGSVIMSARYIDTLRSDFSEGAERITLCIDDYYIASNNRDTDYDVLLCLFNVKEKEFIKETPCSDRKEALRFLEDHNLRRS